MSSQGTEIKTLEQILHEHNRGQTLFVSETLPLVELFLRQFPEKHIQNCACFRCDEVKSIASKVRSKE